MTEKPPSKAALKRRAKEILNRSTLHSLLSGDDLKFIHSISKQYVEGWVDEPIVGITVFVTPKFKTKSFAYALQSGALAPFSYFRAIDGDKEENDIRMAFRSAIRQQVLDFKKTQVVEPGMVRCSATGGLVPWDGVDIHHDPPFNLLLERFLATRRIVLSVVQISVEFENIDIMDKTLKREWQDYHREHAKLAAVDRKNHDQLHREMAR